MEKEGQQLHVVCSVRRNVGKAEAYCDGKCKFRSLNDMKYVILTMMII